MWWFHLRIPHEGVLPVTWVPEPGEKNKNIMKSQETSWKKSFLETDNYCVITQAFYSCQC